MTDKSHVSMEQHVCPVCGKRHDTGNLLFDTRIRQLLDRYTVTGYSRCPDCQKLMDDGYVAIIAADPAKSDMNNGMTQIEGAHRTGPVLHLRESAFKRIFPSLTIPPQKILFCEPDVIEWFQQKEAERVAREGGENG